MPAIDDERRFARSTPECTLVLGPDEREAIKQVGSAPFTQLGLLQFLGPRWQLKRDEDPSQIIAQYTSGMLLGYGRVSHNIDFRPTHVEIEYSLNEKRLLDFTLSRKGLIESLHDQRTMIHPFERSVAVISSSVQIYRRPNTMIPVELYAELVVREQHPDHKHAIFISCREDRFVLE
ncbi:MAG: hypothetical protein UZ21_OP11001000038 [Microgenomates bacterium OLB22]|nr:MAG: hypothetical protein UZ21_OP11001000038 [Microgenomates bacterium OLB22]